MGGDRSERNWRDFGRDFGEMTVGGLPACSGATDNGIERSIAQCSGTSPVSLRLRIRHPTTLPRPADTSPPLISDICPRSGSKTALFARCNHCRRPGSVRRARFSPHVGRRHRLQGRGLPGDLLLPVQVQERHPRCGHRRRSGASSSFPPLENPRAREPVPADRQPSWPDRGDLPHLGGGPSPAPEGDGARRGRSGSARSDRGAGE